MVTVASQPDPQEVENPPVSPPLSSSLAIKQKRSTVVDQQGNPHANQANTMANNQNSSTRSLSKRHLQTSKKQPAAKRFKPPMVTRSPQVTISPMVTGSPMMRLYVSPMAIGARSPSPFLSPLLPSPILERSMTLATSPPPSASHDPGSRSAGNKPRKLRSAIWNDMDPIYHDGKVVEAKCKHCYENLLS